METSLPRISALTIGLGSVLFLAAAFSPISRVFGEPSSARRLAVILAAPRQWWVAQGLFALGALVTALGIATFALGHADAPFAGMLWKSAALLLVGAVCWSWHVYLRAADPAAFAGGELPSWGFAVYTLLTQVGLFLFGLALLRAGLPPWLGWLAAGGMVLLFLVTVIARDMPPFVYYLITLTAGVVLYRAG